MGLSASQYDAKKAALEAQRADWQKDFDGASVNLTRIAQEMAALDCELRQRRKTPAHGGDMSKYEEIWDDNTRFTGIFRDIDARLAALEGEKVTEVFTDTTHGFAGNMASVKDSATVAEASDEEVAIATVRACVAIGRLCEARPERGHLGASVTASEAGRVLAALDRVTRERDEAQSQVVLREAFHERESMRINARIADLEAQLAARVDAKPMERLPIDGMHWFENGLRMAKPAVPVYEHPPAAVIEPTTTGATAMDAEIIASIRELENVDGFPILYNTTINHIVAVLRPLFDRAEHREPPKVVGACVVWKGGEVARSWMPTEYRAQKQCESLAVQNAILDAGTAHRLVLGEEITP